MSTIPINIKHLVKSAPPNIFQWVAEYDGGQILTQYGKPGRSFNNIQKFSDDDDLEKLHLIRLIPGSEDKFSPDMRPCFTVDFKTGFFTINGKESNENPPEKDMYKVKFRPVYYRRVRGGIGINQGPSYASIVKYYWIGWQATIDGKNYQRLLRYDVPNNIPDVVRKR